VERDGYGSTLLLSADVREEIKIEAID